MTCRAILIVLILGLSAASLWSQTTAPPASDGPATLPMGHPPIRTNPGATSSPGGHPALPAGHPTMPQGHPAMGGDLAPGSQPDVKASLIVRAVQGTKDGPVVRGDAVVVELYQFGRVVKKIDAKLDDRGVAILEDLPVGLGAQAVVTVTHAGVAYRQISPAMDADHPDQQVKLVVNETTETAPAWSIKMRHLLVQPDETGGLYVKEIVVVENPTDRAWLGKADAAGGRATVVLALPPSVAEPDIAAYIGFDRSCTRYNEKTGQLTITAPLVPGKSKYQFGYVLPVKKGKAQLPIEVTAATDQIMVSMSNQLGAAAKAKGLKELNAGPESKMFSVNDLAAGAKVSIDFSGLDSRPAAPGQKSSASSGVPQTIAAVGGGVVLVAGLAYLLLKSPRPSAQQKG